MGIKKSMFSKMKSSRGIFILAWSFFLMNSSLALSAKTESRVNTAVNEQIVQQQKLISGTVTDEKGEPIIGASIAVKGSNRGTVSDQNGRFSIQASMGSIVEISYIGFDKQEIKITQKNTYEIQLKESLKDLNEVVVVGYGIKKKIDLTASITSIDGKELSSTPVANLSNSLAGRVSGVIGVNSSGAPGSGSTLRIRGFSTLNDNSPLVVVDGVPRDNFDAFDPNEIESITVLKDGAASAIYGARANNGVFLVTTKRGKEDRIHIVYSGSLSVQKPTMYPKPMSAYQYAVATNEALDNAGYSKDNPQQAGRYFTDDAIEKYRTGKDGADWYDEAFKNLSLMQNHNVSISGGTQKIKYFLSISALNQDGMYDNINYRAYKFRSNTDVDLTKDLSLGVSIDGRQENTKSPYVGSSLIFQHMSRTNPTFKTYYADGRPVNTAGEHVIEEIKHSGYNKGLYNTFQGTLSLNWNLNFITQGLSAKANVSYGKYYNFSKAFNTPYTIYTEDSEGNVIGTKTNGGNGGKTALTESFDHNYSSFLNVGLYYNHSFNKHNVSGLLLYEQSNTKGDNFYGTKQDFAISTKDELFASGPENQDFSGSGYLSDARRSVVGRINYDYANKYLLEATFRLDGSYKFPKGNRYGFFPSFSAGWRISEESFLRDSEALSFISNLKLRASFAEVGNDKVSPYQFEDSYTMSSNYGPFFNNEAQAIIYYGVFPNKNITWETADNFDIGLDLELWRGLLGIEFDYFLKKTRDILWSRVRSVPATFGRSLPNENYAKMRNSGFDMTLSHTNHIGLLSYSLKGTLSYAVNKVTRIDDPSNALDYQKQLNRPLGFRSGYKALGLFQSKEEAQNYMGGKQFGVTSLAGDIKYEDVNKDGVIDSKDQTVISKYNNTPRMIFGLSGETYWKGFDFGFLLQGAAMRNIMLSMNSRVTLSDGGNSYAYLLDAWSPTNKGAKYPLLWTGSRSVNNRNSSYWLKNADYLRLKTITLGYSISLPVLRKIYIEKIRVYVSGTNLLTWTPLDGFDPEAGAGNGAYYPQQKLYSIGMNINF